MKSVLVIEYDIVTCDQSRKLTGHASKIINSAELPDFKHVSVFVLEASFLSSRLMSLSDARIAWLFMCPHAFFSLPIPTPVLDTSEGFVGSYPTVLLTVIVASLLDFQRIRPALFGCKRPCSLLYWSFDHYSCVLLRLVALDFRRLPALSTSSSLTFD